MPLLTYCHDAHFDESNRSRVAIVIAALLIVLLSYILLTSGYISSCAEDFLLLICYTDNIFLAPFLLVLCLPLLNGFDYLCFLTWFLAGFCHQLLHCKCWKLYRFLLNGINALCWCVSVHWTTCKRPVKYHRCWHISSTLSPMGWVHGLQVC